MKQTFTVGDTNKSTDNAELQRSTQEMTTSVEETPTVAQETPTAEQEIPTVAQETPTAEQEIPTVAQETPTAEQETPTAMQETPATMYGRWAENFNYGRRTENYNYGPHTPTRPLSTSATARRLHSETRTWIFLFEGEEMYPRTTTIRIYPK